MMNKLVLAGVILCTPYLRADIIRTNAYGLGADAQVDEQNGGNTPRGDFFELAARYTPPSTHNQHMMIRLDLSGITLTELDSNVLSTFRLYVNRNGWNAGAAAFEYYGLKPESSNQLWNESTVTFQNAPGLTYDGDMTTRGFSTSTTFLGESSFSGAKPAGTAIDFSSTLLASFVRDAITYANTNATAPVATLFVALKAGSPTGANYIVKSNDADLFQGTGLLAGEQYNPQLRFTPLPSGDVTVQWQGGTGSWNDPNKWSPVLVSQNNVTTTYSVNIPSATDNVSLNIDATIEQFRLTDGTLTVSGGPHTLTVNRPISWNGGALFAGGDGSTLIAMQGGEISGDYAVFSAGTLENRSQFTSRVNKILNLAAVQNIAGAIFDFKSDCWVDGSKDFINQGIFSKSAGTGLTEFSVPITNNGIVRVSSGTLSFRKINSSSDGTMETLAGGTLSIGINSSATMEVPASTKIIGDGNLQFWSTTLTVRGQVNVTGTTTFKGNTVFPNEARITSLGKTVVTEPGNGTLGLFTGDEITIETLINNNRVEGTDLLRVTGSLTGIGQLNINTIVSGSISAGNPVGLLSISKNLTLSSTGESIFQLSDSAADSIFGGSGSSMTIAGKLTLLTSGTFTPESTDVLTLIEINDAIFGTFNNVLPGNRLMISGLGSFKVNYGSTSPYGINKLVISDFQTIPEPGFISILSCTGFVLLKRKRSTLSAN